ncbi:MAG: dual specificity protein phosphatase family protein [Theionarchaea archaeon]|nr:dual specificity protein phosphatase family protein [Theionarchaea archaeon]
MDHCYWITEKLAGRCGPLKHQWDLDELYKKGFRVIISLDDKIDADTITEKGFTHIPLYVPDLALTTPSLKQLFLKAAETFVDIVASEKEPILVHCYAGNDRTGAMLACFLISQGMPADKAISEVRRLNPTAMVTPGYEDVVYQFAALHTERI